MKYPKNLKSISRVILFSVSILFGFLYHISFLGVIALWYATIYTLEKVTGLKYSIKFESITLLFIILSSYLGTSLGFYEKFGWWDKMLHFTYGFCFAFIGYKIISSILQKRLVGNQLLLTIIFSFCFSVAIGAIWEIIEFSFDKVGIWYFGEVYWSPLVQTNPAYGEDAITDTMHDIMIETFSALLLNFMTYCYYTFGIFTFIETFNLTIQEKKEEIKRKIESNKQVKRYSKRIKKILRKKKHFHKR